MNLAQRILVFTAAANKIPANSPTGQFLRHFDAMKVEPFKAMLGVGREYEFGSVDVKFNLMPQDNHTVVLQSLFAANPKSGEGSQALQIICTVADRHQVTILLDASPYDTAMTRNKLIAWYQRFGFVRTIHTEMQRLPQ